MKCLRAARAIYSILTTNYWFLRNSFFPLRRDLLLAGGARNRLPEASSRNFNFLGTRRAGQFIMTDSFLGFRRDVFRAVLCLSQAAVVRDSFCG